MYFQVSMPGAKEIHRWQSYKRFHKRMGFEGLNMNLFVRPQSNAVGGCFEKISCLELEDIA